MRAFQILPLLCLSFSTPAFPETLAEKNAAHEISTAFMACFAYYQYAMFCGANSVSHNEQESLAKAYKSTSEYAYSFGRRAGHSSAEILDMMKGEIDSLANETQRSCQNFAPVTRRHASSCGPLMERPEERYQELVKSLSLTLATKYRICRPC